VSQNQLPYVAVVAVFALLACSEDSTGIPEAPTGSFTVLDQSLWPGEAVRVTSEDFTTWGDDATLTIGGVVVPMERVDATTLEADLPEITAGTVVPTIQFDGYLYQLDAITVAGFKRTDLPTGTPVVWDAYIMDIAGVPHVIGGALDHTLAVVNLEAATVATYPIFDYARIRGPGMTWQADNWVMNSGNGYELWNMAATPTKVRDLTEAPIQGGDRQVAWLSEHVWLRTAGNSWTLFKRADAQSPFEINESAPAIISEPEGIHLSPAGNRAAMRVDRILAGVPVFDAVAGDVAFVTDLTTVQGVSFSANGSLLALAGGKGGGPEDATSRHVELLNAVSGAVLASTQLTDSPFAIHIDPAGDHIFVGISDSDASGSRPAVLVLDADDLSLIARLEPPATSPICGFSSDFSCIGGVITRHGDEVIVYYGWNGPPRIWKYALLP
jgi:hypothetical protein